MIQELLSDPSFIPVTIVFSLFVLFSYWQELNKYVIHLSIVYATFLFFTAISYSDYDQADEKKDIFVNKDSSEEVLLSEDTNRVKDDDLNLESSSAFAIKKYIPKEEEKDNSPKTISVKRLIVCENINFKLRKPIRIRDVFLDTTSRIYCFAGIKNPDKSENISHYWEYNGKPYATVHMNISVSEYFRCWSYVTPKEGNTGQWSISVIDDQNNILEKQEFTIEPYADSGN